MAIGKHVCYRCNNFLGNSESQNDEFGKCKAFPNGIPYEIYAYMHHWDKPKNCNNGIGFESKEPQAETENKTA